MVYPLPLRNTQGVFPTLAGFNRTTRRKMGTYIDPLDRLMLSSTPSSPLKRNFSQNSEGVKIPTLMTKRQRTRFFERSGIVSSAEDCWSETGYSSLSSPISWGKANVEYLPTENTSLRRELLLAELDFRWAARQHFSALDVEGLIADPGPELRCNDDMRGEPEICDLRPHPPMRGCLCHSCATHEKDTPPLHDLNMWCYCFDCDHFRFVEELKEKAKVQKLEAEKLKVGQVMDMVDYTPKEQTGDFDMGFLGNSYGGDLFGLVKRQLREG